jgi:PPIC-type PPIASE domain.
VAAASLLSAGLILPQAQAASSQANADDPLATVMRVNGSRITEAQLNIMARSMLLSGGDPASAGDSAAERNRAATTDLVIQEVLAEQAAKEKLNKEPEVEDALASSRREILSKAFLAHYFDAHPVTDAQLRSAYEYKRVNGKIMEYRVHQILEPTRADVEAILARLHRGEKLSDLVKLTKDPGGNTNGGLLNPNGGWFQPDLFVDTFLANAVENLKPGQPPQKAIRSRFGWHLLWINKPPRAVKNPPPFDDLPSSAVKALRQRAMQVRMNQVIDGLLAKAKIVGANGKKINGADLTKDNP